MKDHSKESQRNLGTTQMNLGTTQQNEKEGAWRASLAATSFSSAVAKNPLALGPALHP